MVHEYKIYTIRDTLYSGVRDEKWVCVCTGR